MKLANQVTEPVVDRVDKTPKEHVDDFGFTDIEVIDFCNEVLHESQTPLALGAIAFDPLDHERPGVQTVYRFRVTGFVNPGNPARVFLRNMTDGWELLPSVTLSTAGVTTEETTLFRGTSVGNIDDGEHIYECRVELTSPEAPGEFAQVLSATLVIEHGPPSGGGT